MSEEGGLVIYTEEAIRVSHEYMGGPHGGFILLPLGLRINRNIAEAKEGTALEFIDGERARLIGTKIVKCNDVVTNGLSMVRYGMSMMNMRNMWKRQAVYAGAGVNAIDTDECLLVFYKRKV